MRHFWGPSLALPSPTSVAAFVITGTRGRNRPQPFSKFGIDRQQEYPFHRYPRLLNISPNDFVRFRLNKLECNYSLPSSPLGIFLATSVPFFFYPRIHSHRSSWTPRSSMHFHHLSKREGILPFLFFLFFSITIHQQVPVNFARLLFFSFFFFLPPFPYQKAQSIPIRTGLVPMFRSLARSLLLGHASLPPIIADRHYHEFLAGFRRCLTRIDGSVPATAENRAKLTSSGWDAATFRIPTFFVLCTSDSNTHSSGSLRTEIEVNGRWIIKR